MSADTDTRLIAMLERIVGESKQMQQAGRLADPTSRRELAMLEHKLRALRAKAQATDPEARTGDSRRVAVVLNWAHETRAMSAATRHQTRELRKQLYRLRLIEGGGAAVAG